MHLYTDGACSGNPGPGGWAVVHISQLDNKVLDYRYGAKERTTNNEMELSALIAAMAWAKEYTGDHVRIFTDSSYGVKGITEWLPGWKKRGWTKADGKPVLNLEIWKKIDSLYDSTKMSIVKVKGHAGIYGNEMADHYATSAVESL